MHTATLLEQFLDDNRRDKAAALNDFMEMIQQTGGEDITPGIDGEIPPDMDFGSKFVFILQPDHQWN